MLGGVEYKVFYFLFKYYVFVICRFYFILFLNGVAWGIEVKKNKLK